MSDLTDKQRVERAHHAKRALEEFLEPAFAVVTAEYGARLLAVCAKEPWATDRIAALANATRIVEEVKAQIVSLVYDGESAKQEIERVRRIEALTPRRRRLVEIGLA